MLRPFDRLQVGRRPAIAWLTDAAGQDLVEYGLLAALITMFAVGAVRVLGEQLDALFWQTIAQNF